MIWCANASSVWI